MGITSSIGLASGIDTASLINQLMAIEARPKQLAQRRIAELQQQQAAFLDINSAMLGLGGAAEAFRQNDVFDASTASSSNPSALAATVTGKPPAGEYDFIVDRLVTTQRRLSRGFTDRNTTGLGLNSITFEQGGGNVQVNTDLSALNGGNGIERGKIRITDKAGNNAEIDLSKAATVNEVLDAINANADISVTASTDGNGFVITDTSGGAGNLRIESSFGYNTAESLGIAANTASNTVNGSNLRTISRNTALRQLNDGTGVLIKDGSTDLSITARTSGAPVLAIDLGEKSQTVTTEEFEFDGTNYAAGTLLSTLQALPGFNDLDDDDKPETEKEITQSRATTVGDVIDIINAEAIAKGVDIIAEISADGRGITISDTSGDDDRNLLITNGPSGDTAASLGIVADTASSTVQSRDLIADINSVLTTSLNGGNGLSAADLDVTDSANNNTDLSGIDTSGSLSDLIERINTQLAADSSNLTARINSAGNGIAFDDSGPGTFAISINGGLAEQLGVDTASSTESTIEGRSSQLKWIGLSTAVSSLNNGAGIGNGEIRITDSTGASTTLTIGSSTDDNSSIKNIDDLIRRLNTAPEVNITASINNTGDGILITDDAGGSNALIIEDVTGAVANNLNIAGTFEDQGFGTFADGSFEQTLQFDESDTLDQVIASINDAGVGVVASVVNDGSANTPFRLSLTSRDTGTDGRVIVDPRGADLGLDITEEGDNAKVFFGSDDPAEALLINSSTNTLTEVIQGVTLDLKATSDEPITVAVAQNDSTATDAAEALVSAFNNVIKAFDKYDTYNEDSEVAGPLLGDNTVSNLRRRLYNVVQAPAQNTSSSFNYLFEIGIRVGEGAKLEFNEEKFANALQQDRQGVENLLAAFKQAPNEPEEIFPGAFVNNPEPSFETLGIAELIAQTVDGITDSIDGTITNKDDSIQRQIDLQEDRIANFDIQLSIKRQQLEAEFLAMEKAIADLQSQQQALAQLQG